MKGLTKEERDRRSERIVIMIDEKGLTTKQVAERLGMYYTSVRHAYKKGRKALR